jgi:hypothetical protein
MTKGRVVVARNSAQGKPNRRSLHNAAAPVETKNGSRSATTVPQSTGLPFVISTEAQRSGEISVWMLLLGDVFNLYSF